MIYNYLLSLIQFDLIHRQGSPRNVVVKELDRDIVGKQVRTSVEFVRSLAD